MKKSIIDFIYMILFFINCTDFSRNYFTQKRYCFTDNNPRRLNGKNYLPLLIASFCIKIYIKL